MIFGNFEPSPGQRASAVAFTRTIAGAMAITTIFSGENAPTTSKFQLSRMDLNDLQTLKYQKNTDKKN